MKDILEKNSLIIYNECKNLASQICSNITPSGHPIIISGNGIYVISGLAPNPTLGILNPRFLNQSNVDDYILQALNKSNKIFKAKAKKSISTLGGGSTSKIGSIVNVVNTIKRTKKNISVDNQDQLKQIYIEGTIRATVKDILKLRLITPLKLPQSSISLYSKQVCQKTIVSDTNYGLYDLNLLMIETIIKSINF